MLEVPYQYYFKETPAPNGEVFAIQPNPKPIYAEYVTQITRECWAQARNAELSYTPTIGGLTLPEVLQQSGFEVSKDGSITPIVWDLSAQLRYSPRHRTEAEYGAPWKYVGQPWLPKPKLFYLFIQSLNLEDI